MSQHHHQQQQTQSQISGNNKSSSGSSIPISEVYWSLVEKADKKFSKIRDLPCYERHRYDTYFYKVFKVYTQLWKFQQENRQKLVEAGLKRWEIGEIASRIAQLYFGQYMRTSETNFLSEAYVFYEAILTREYFREGSYQDIHLANKQLRFLARFLMVSLIFNKREMVNQLVNQLKLLLDEYKRTFQESYFKEWKLVVQEITRFLKADTAFLNTRPLRYSLVLDTHPDSFPQAVASVANRTLRLREAILSSYHHYEVKFSELTLDTFRMLQSLEWEPSGFFYQPAATKVGASGRSQTNFIQDIVDPTLPANPRKAVLYRPSVTHFVAVLATICEELPADGVLLIYLSASGRGVAANLSQSGLGTFLNPKENMVKNVKRLAISSDASSSTQCDQKSDTTTPSPGESKDDSASDTNPCLQFGNHGNGGLNCIYPCDLLPFTRKPLFLIIDSESSTAFQAICGAEKGEPAALLLSPRSSATAASDFSHPCRSLFTIFLTAPLQAFCIMLGFSNSEVDMDAFTKAEKLLASSLDDFGSILATSDTLNPVWAQILNDPFLRRLLLRFIFCQAVLGLYNSTYGKEELMPKCMPHLPESVMPTNVAIQSMVLHIANVFGVANRFHCREVVISESRNSEIGSRSFS